MCSEGETFVGQERQCRSYAPATMDEIAKQMESQNYGRTAGVDGLVTAMIQGFGDFRGKKHLFTKTWDEISQL